MLPCHEVHCPEAQHRKRAKPRKRERPVKERGPHLVKRKRAAEKESQRDEDAPPIEKVRKSKVRNHGLSVDYDGGGDSLQVVLSPDGRGDLPGRNPQLDRADELAPHLDVERPLNVSKGAPVST